MTKPLCIARVVSVLLAALPFGSTTPPPHWPNNSSFPGSGAGNSEARPILPRDSPPTTDLNPLDYAPDFSEDPFPPYPDIHQPDGSNFTAQNWRGTRLFGWKGCGTSERTIITETWNDFYKLAQQKSLYQNINWNSQAAKEIWNNVPEVNKQLSDATKEQIKRIYQSTQQMYDSYWLPPYDGDYSPPTISWRTLWIRVQCSPEGDDANLCGDKGKPPPNCPGGSPPPPGKEATVEAYSDNDKKYSKVTFCGYFFNNMRSLSEVTADAKNRKTDQNDLWSYQNRARVMFHEMTHLDYFMNAPAKSPQTDDLRVDIKEDGKKKETKGVACYGPECVKALALYQQVNNGGFFTQRNADSFAWFAMAKWAESQIGRYPTNPVVTKVPLRAPRQGNNKRFSLADDAADAAANSDDEPLTQHAAHLTPGCPDVIRAATNSVGLASAKTGEASCDNKDALSGVPFNVFSGQDTGLYGQFCYQTNPSEKSEWTVDQHGNQKIPSKVKRTPPNPTAYSSFNFNLKWEPKAEPGGCEQTVDGCTYAFQAMANSPCGHQGGEQNTMTAAGQFDIPNCGTYSYSITGPNVPKPAAPAPPAPPAPSIGSQWCYTAFSGHDDIQGKAQSKAADDACARADGHMITSDPRLHEYCHAGKPLADKPDTCSSLLNNDYTNCNNGGVGGNIIVGCLTYQFSIGGKP